MLTDHIDQLHGLANALLEYETLTGEEIKRLIAGEDLGREDPGANATPGRRGRHLDPQDPPAQGSVRQSGAARRVSSVGVKPVTTSPPRAIAGGLFTCGAWSAADRGELFGSCRQRRR